MKKIAFLVKDLAASQLSFLLIRYCNALADSRGADPVVFYEGLQRPCLEPRFACMQMAEAYLFDAPAVATTLATAGKLLAMPACPRRFFYAWDLEWLRPWGRRPFRGLQGVYGSPLLTVLARSADHASVLSNAFNRDDVPVVDDFHAPALGRALFT